MAQDVHLKRAIAHVADAINRIRESARTTLGDQFDIKAFHDVVLTNGATPLSVTESLVSEWVATVSGPARN